MEERLELSRLGTGQMAFVVFVGSHLTFSKHALRILQAEHSEMEFLRVSSLRELDEITAEHGKPTLTVLDEVILIPLLDDDDELLRLTSDNCLALAYRDPMTARNLVAKSNEVEALENVGVLPLNAEIEVWLSMFNLLLCGEVFYPRVVMDAIQDTVETQHIMPTDRLTPREWEVLNMVAEGQQNKTIAAKLSLSEHTVKLHVHHVLKKLSVSNRTGAANWFAKYGADS